MKKPRNTLLLSYEVDIFILAQVTGGSEYSDTGSQLTRQPQCQSYNTSSQLDEAFFLCKIITLLFLVNNHLIS
jgi:hypothetical protein